MKKILTLFLFSTISLVQAQGPQVPSTILFADMKLNLTEAARKEIQRDVDQLTRNPTYFQRKADRASLYFPIVEKVFREEGLPEEFKYLAIQESAFIADAISISKAVGFWQFKVPAAKEVGMRIDRHIDERMNIEASSRGAAKYLKSHNEQFDNWIYSLTAYYTGLGGAKNFVNDKNFGKRKLDIKKSTHWYVKKFLAHLIAYRSASDPTGGEELVLTIYTRGGGKSLKEIASETSSDPDLLEEYNKWLLKGDVPTDKTYSVIVPLKNGQKREYLAVEKTKEPEDLKTASTEQFRFPIVSRHSPGAGQAIVKVNKIPALIAQDGESLKEIARRGRIDLADLLRFNDINSLHEVKHGEVYYLKKKKNRAKIHFHTVHPSENLWQISQKYGLKLKKLLQKNRMKSVSEVDIGRVLWLRNIRPENIPIEYRKLIDPIPEKEPLIPTEEEQIKDQILDTVRRDLIVTQVKPDPEDSLLVLTKADTEVAEESKLSDTVNNSDDQEVFKAYVVQSGETLYGIAKAHEMTVDKLMKINRLTQSDTLKVGQQLRVKNEERNDLQIPDRNIKKVVHTVASGDTLYGIARQYGVKTSDILVWNDKEGDGIKIEEKLIIWVKDTLDLNAN